VEPGTARKYSVKDIYHHYTSVQNELSAHQVRRNVSLVILSLALQGTKAPEEGIERWLEYWQVADHTSTATYDGHIAYQMCITLQDLPSKRTTFIFFKV
jgi:hypothetical protein